MASRPRLQLACVLLFTFLLSLPFLGGAYSIDEPYFLAMAEQILRDPLRPTDFDINWYGAAQRMSEINTHPLGLPYLLAAALKITGGSEFLTRALLLAFDLAAAAALYLIAARFLKQPLWPALIVLAGPGWLLSMHRLMAEKWVMSLGLWSIFALLKGLEGRRNRSWYWASAALAAAALLFKYTAIFLAAPLIALQYGRVPARRLAAYLAAVLAPLAAYLLWGAVYEPGRLASVWDLTSRGAAMKWSSWHAKLRATLAFFGGLSLAAAAWPAFFKVRRPAAALAAGALVVALYLPAFDVDETLLHDRVLGIVFSCWSVWALSCLWEERSRLKRHALWLAWIGSVLFLQLFVYWSVVGRFMFFATPAVVFWLAQLLEDRLPAERRGRLYRLSFAGALAVTLGLLSVDSKHADSARRLARELAPPEGRKLWYTGHWGLQYYLEKAGAAGLDRSRGGWDEVKRGDVVIVPRANTNQLRPARPRLSNVRVMTVESANPLRLIAFSRGQAAFYSSAWGFLPFAFSSEPVEEYSVVEVLE